MESRTIKMHQNKPFLEDYKCKLFEAKDPVYKKELPHGRLFGKHTNLWEMLNTPTGGRDAFSRVTS